eukprot:9245209-Pyramimonas_sp.AAC.1
MGQIYDVARYDHRPEQLGHPDIGRLRRYVRQATKRRAVPEGAPPLGPPVADATSCSGHASSAPWSGSA